MKKLKEMTDRELQEKLVYETTVIRLILQNSDSYKNLNWKTSQMLDEWLEK